MKWVLLYLILSLIWSFNFLFSQVPFTVERIGTDYNGVIEANGRIIAYGNNGVLTFSDDFGEHWRQINLGEFIDILKIIKDESNTLYALTRNAILVSKDKGNFWVQKNITSDSDLIDVAIKDNLIYAISPNKIFMIDKEFNSEPGIFLEFDNFTYFSKSEIIGNYLFVVESDFNIFRIQINTKKVDTIDIRTKYNFGGLYKSIANIKINSNALYILVENGNNQIPTEFDYTNKRHLILKSTDLGNTWEFVTSNIPITKDFDIDYDGSIFTLAPILLTQDNLRYFSVSFVKDKDTTFQEHIQTDSSGIWFPYFTAEGDGIQTKYAFSSIRKINDIIIAVGNYKTILLSKDGGENWKMVSFFRPLFNSAAEFYDLIIKADTFVVLTDQGPNCFVSTDAGATFVPISRQHWIELARNFSLQRMPLAFPNGNFAFVGWKITSKGKLTDTLVAKVSKNFGKTFSTLEYPIGTKIINDTISALFKYKFFINDKNRLLFSFILYRGSGPKWIFCFFDTDFNLVDTILIYDYYYYFQPYGGGIIILDSSGIHFSSDLGKSKSLLSILPKKRFFKNYNDYLSYSLLGIFRNKALILESSPSNYKLLSYDIVENYYDSIPMPNYIYSTFIMNDTVFITTDDTVYIFPYFETNLKYFLALPITQIISDGLNFLSAIRRENGSYLLALTKRISSGFSSVNQLNFATISHKNNYLKIEPEVDKNFVYLFAYPPFPNPVHNYLHLKVYWDSDFGKDNISISIYNIKGEKINSSLVNFIPENSFNGLIEIDCSVLPSGIYIVTISLENRTIAMPFVVQR
ncbi:T9SS C-terminal target domain-containing protein [Bacteroidetes/Chlorobi group bacterium Naka2016]|jgi:hypothetical protein|nr:MAG: T9SS C-terminal target domain-containing protein [Bacteroidetes/Chlorobi group bacterium Naka2016]